MAKAIVTEQCIKLSPIKGREWVFQHQPGMLSKAVQLMEDSVEAKRSLEAESPKAFRGQGTNWKETQVGELKPVNPF